MRILSLMIAYSLKQVFGFPCFTTIAAVVSAYNLSCATPVVVLEPTSKIFYEFSVKNSESWLCKYDERGFCNFSCNLLLFI